MKNTLFISIALMGAVTLVISIYFGISEVVIFGIATVLFGVIGAAPGLKTV